MSIIKKMSEAPKEFVKNPKSDFTRTRKLPFSTMLSVLLSMGGNSLPNELLEHFNWKVDTVSASAFVQQRNKISSAALPFLFHKFTNTAQNLKTHRGYRILAVDGSALNIYTNPNDKDTYFQQQPNHKGFNQLHLNVSYDLCNKLYTDIAIQPRRKMNENRALTDLIDNSHYPEKTIIVADRNYESYNTFAHIEVKGYRYVVRVKDLGSTGILRGLDLPKTNEFDIEISLNLTRKQTKKAKVNPKTHKFLPAKGTFDYLEPKTDIIYPISFRVLRFLVRNGKYETIITNLDKSEFVPTDIKNLYKMRWGIETSFRELKYSIGLVQLHAKKSEFVEQEIFARLIMYNFCSMIIAQVEIKQKSTKYEYQANFTMAVQICKLFLRGKSPPGDVEALIQKFILPIRENRTNARNISAKSFVSFTYRVA